MNQHQDYAQGKGIFLFAGNAHPQLAQEIADWMKIPLGKVTLERFPDGESFVQYHENIRGGDVYIVQPTCPNVNENLMELLIMLDAARRASAYRVTAIIPYYGYARQDRKDRPRVPISAKLVANLLTTAGAHRILTMDLHSTQIQGFFDIPVDHLYASPILVPYLKQFGPDAVVVAPDSGSVKMAHAYAEKLGYGLAVIAKRRVNAESVESSHLVGDVAGKVCILTDDMTSTCGTLISAANLLKSFGAAKIYAAVSHSLLNQTGLERLKNSCIEELVTTNGVPPLCNAGNKVKALTIAPLFGEAIRRIHEYESVSSLFSIKK